MAQQILFSHRADRAIGRMYNERCTMMMCNPFESHGPFALSVYRVDCCFALNIIDAKGYLNRNKGRSQRAAKVIMGLRKCIASTIFSEQIK